jgi:glycine/D-amino acid oxidase-like deaminating enzyme
MASRIPPSCDVLIIGGGFYGCEIALEFRKLGFDRVVIVERELEILSRASFVNQARVHNGYHYPRSHATAMRSHLNFERFLDAYSHAVAFEAQMLYAIARGSRVSAGQFESFCRLIGAPCEPAPQRFRSLFDLEMIEECFLVREFAFNPKKLAQTLRKQLEHASVDVRLGEEARVTPQDGEVVEIRMRDRVEYASWVINCTYSELEFVGVPIRTQIKKELAELLLIRPPSAIANVGVTVMDGPFFSTMPFPAARLHSLSHVRYTPHEASILANRELLLPVRSNRTAMIRDAARYLPLLANAQVVDSLFEIKATRIQNEDNDGRPILIEKCGQAPRVLSVLGAKVDNIFDVCEYIRTRKWELC